YAALLRCDCYHLSSSLLRPPSRHHTLPIFPSTTLFRSYSFRLVNYATATTITPGTPVNDTFNPATETDIYKFNVAAPNSKFYFEITTAHVCTPGPLVDRNPSTVCKHNFSTDNDTLTLAQ